MKVFLSITLDKVGNIKKDLYLTDSLESMDVYMQKYANSKEVREEYQNEIHQFLKDNKWYLDGLILKAYRLSKKPRRNEGRITISFSDNNGNRYFVPAIYRNYELIRRVNMKEIEKSLLDDNNFQKIVNERSYLFGNSEYVISTINLYKKYHYDKYKKMLINLLINIIKESPKEKRYYYFRCLANPCNLIKKNVIKIKYGEIDCSNIVDNTVLRRNQIAMDCDDEFFMNLLDKGDYEALFKYYDLEKILKYSKDLDNPLGSRRKNLCIK